MRNGKIALTEAVAGVIILSWRPEMRRSFFMITGLILLTVATVPAAIKLFGVIKQQQVPIAKPTILEIHPADLNFGTVWATDSLDWPITITNQSNATVDVTHLGGSCTCQQFSETAFQLEPGQSHQVTVTLTLRNDDLQPSQKNTVPFRAAIWANIKGQRESIDWQLAGLVKTAVRTPNRLDLGLVSELKPAEAITTFYMIPDAAVRQVFIKSQPSCADITTENKPGYIEAKVTPLKDIRRGRHSDKIELECYDAQGEPVQSPSFVLTFEVSDDLQAMPSTINFGDRPIGETTSETISFYSLSRQEIQDVVIQSCPAGVQAKLVPGAMHTVQLSVVANEPIEKQELVLSVKSDKTGWQELRLPVRLGVYNPEDFQK